MGNNVHTFEVRVEVKKKGSVHYSHRAAMYIENKVVKMFHKDARTGEQAMRKCEKHGRPLSARKVNEERMMRGNIDTLMLRLKPVNPYPNAIAIDEFIWRRKSKRAERLDSRAKDKNGY